MMPRKKLRFSVALAKAILRTAMFLAVIAVIACNRLTGPSGKDGRDLNGMLRLDEQLATTGPITFRLKGMLPDRDATVPAGGEAMFFGDLCNTSPDLELHYQYRSVDDPSDPEPGRPLKDNGHGWGILGPGECRAGTLHAVIIKPVLPQRVPWVRIWGCHLLRLRPDVFCSDLNPVPKGHIRTGWTFR